MRSPLALSLALTLPLVPACQSGGPPEGFFHCTAATASVDCPPHWYCHSDLLCWSRVEMPDAATPDAFTPDAFVPDSAMPDAGVDAAMRDSGVDAPAPIDAYVPDSPTFLDDGCVLATYYLDGDGDHYGQSSMTMQACSQPSGYVGVGGDCNDSASAIHPMASETCNGIDDDCSGSADDGGALECVMSHATPCTTTCGSVGSGVCSLACREPTGASCSPPTSETICDGSDDDCNGVADEGLGSIGPAVTALTHGGSSTSEYGMVRIAPSPTGYVLFVANRDFPARIFMQSLTRTGAPMGSLVPLDARIAPAIVGLSVLRVSGGYVLAYGQWSFGTGPTGPVTLAAIDDAGAIRSFGTLAPPAGYGVFQRVVLVAPPTGTVVNVYASLRSTDASPTFAIRRYTVDYASAAPNVLAQTAVATDLAPTESFEVAHGGSDEWVLYHAFNDDVRLLRVALGPTVIGTIVRTVSPGLAIALASDGPVDAANPLGVVWVDNAITPSPGTHFVEVTNAAPFTMRPVLDLPGGSPPPAGITQLLAEPNASIGSRSSQWLVERGTRVWEVLGHGGTATATMWTPPDSIGIAWENIAVSGGARMAQVASAFDVVTRRVGCR